MKWVALWLYVCGFVPALFMTMTFNKEHGQEKASWGDFLSMVLWPVLISSIAISGLLRAAFAGLTALARGRQ